MDNAIYSQTLLAGVAERHPMPLAQVKAAAMEVLSLIKEGLIRDGSVRVQNFGTFRLKHVAEHLGRNPQTGETITIKAQNRVIFTPAKALRELIEPNRASATPVTEAKPEGNPISKPAIKAAALASSPIRVNTSVPETEQLTQSMQPENREIKSTGKIYFWGAGAALLIFVLIFLLQEDQEISTQTAISNQPATTVQSAPDDQADIADQSVMPMATENVTASSTKQISTEASAVTEPPVAETVATSNPEPIAQQTLQEPVLQTTAFFVERKHRLVRGDTLWSLAGKNYGDALLWTHIYQANQDSIKNPDRLREKHLILLPTLQGQADALTEQDRYHIAEGYYLAYLHYKAIGNKDSFFALLEAKRYSPKLVKEKMTSLKLTQIEKILLKHQSNL